MTLPGSLGLVAKYSPFRNICRVDRISFPPCLEAVFILGDSREGHRARTPCFGRASADDAGRIDSAHGWGGHTLAAYCDGLPRCHGNVPQARSRTFTCAPSANTAHLAMSLTLPSVVSVQTLGSRVFRPESRLLADTNWTVQRGRAPTAWAGNRVDPILRYQLQDSLPCRSKRDNIIFGGLRS